MVRRDPGRAQYSSQVQTQRQKDAHEPDQLERGQHRHAHLFHAAARRSHALAPLPPSPMQSRTPGGSKEPKAGTPDQRSAGTLALGTRPSGLCSARRETGGTRRAGKAGPKEVVGSRNNGKCTVDLHAAICLCPRPRLLLPGAARLAPPQRPAPGCKRRRLAREAEGLRSGMALVSGIWTPALLAASLVTSVNNNSMLPALPCLLWDPSMGGMSPGHVAFFFIGSRY